MREIVPDVQMWSVPVPEKGYDFNGFAVNTEDGTVLIDPPEPVEEGWGAIDMLAPFAGLWITNRNHSRAAATFRESYGLKVSAHEGDSRCDEFCLWLGPRPWRCWWDRRRPKPRP